MGALAGWYDDPWNQSDLRWWDGVRWTDRTASTSRAGADGAVPVHAPRAGVEHLIGRDGRIAVIDVETTGLYNTDRVVEIAILTLDCDGRVHDEFETLVQPLRDVGPTWIHGVDAAWCAGRQPSPMWRTMWRRDLMARWSSATTSGSTPA